MNFRGVITLALASLFCVVARAELLTGVTQVIPSVSLLSPSAYILSTPEYQIPYTEKNMGLPSISAVLVHPFGVVNGFEISWLARLGYSYRAGLFNVYYFNRGPISDQLALHVIPIELATRVSTEIPKLPEIRPGLILGLSADIINQVGSLSGTTRTYVVPCLLTGVTFSFFDQAKAPGDLFAGFSFDIVYRHSLGEQMIRGAQLNLGINFLL